MEEERTIRGGVIQATEPTEQACTFLFCACERA